MPSGDSISNKIKSFISETHDVFEASTALSKKRKALKPLIEDIIVDMNDSKLKVVRVLQHPSGPKDVILQDRSKKPTLSKVRLLSCLEEHNGKTLDVDVMHQIIHKLTDTPEDADVKQFLKIAKLTMKDTAEPEAT